MTPRLGRSARAALPVALAVTLAACGGGGSGTASTDAGDLPPILPILTGSGLSAPWATDGDVNALLVAPDGTTYLGGSFTHVGKPTGGWVPLDPATGAKAFAFPVVTGSVTAAVSDGAGGTYIGGRFSHVDGVPRSGLAHLDPDGTLDLGWNVPVLDGSGVTGQVKTLALVGGTLYVGGYFATVGGQARSNLAAVDASGTVLAWNPSPNATVYASLDFRGRLYVGGGFTTIGGEARNAAAALDPTTGAVDPDFAPSVLWSVPAQVYALAANFDTVYLGGQFTSVSGVARGRLAAVPWNSSTPTAWDPNPSGIVLSLAVGPSGYLPNSTALYVGGSYSSIGGAARNGLAAFDTGALGSRLVPALVAGFDPNVQVSTVSGLTVTGSVGVIEPQGPSTVLVGGVFATVGGQLATGLAAVGGATGALLPWAPLAPSGASAIHVAGGAVWVSGAFPGALPRGRLAAIAPDGALAAWDPGANGTVHALARSGTTIYAGGAFTEVGGQPRTRLAALDGTTGAATAWNPAGPNAAVRAIALDGGQVYVGGDFTQVGGAGRNRLAALDGAGALTSWNPNVTSMVACTVNALLVEGGWIYAGGAFQQVGGRQRFNLAAIDPSGVATTWNPWPTEPVRSLAAGGGAIWAGGEFVNVGGGNSGRFAVPRFRMAAFDPVGAGTDAPRAWDAGFPYVNLLSVDAIAYVGTTVWAGGSFTLNDGAGGYFQSLAALDSATAAPVRVGSVPKIGGSVRALGVRGSRVVVGGAFGAVESKASQGYLEVPR